MNYKYKYQSLNEKSSKIDILNTFFEAGFYIKPYYGVDPVSGDCSCGDESCTAQGKHPVLPNNAGFYDKTKYAAWLAEHPTHCTVGVSTGYYKALKRSLVVVDIDDMVHMDAVVQLIPSIKSTFTVKTRKGLHFYFWCDAHDPETGKPVWVNTKIKAAGMAVDILGQGHAGVVAPGSVNKWVLEANEIQTLSIEEVATLNSFSAAKKVYNKSSRKVEKEIVTNFYKGIIGNGEVNAAVVAVSSKQLWNNKVAYMSRIYTLTSHIDWVTEQVKSYIHVPVNMKKIQRTARDMFLRFNPEKFCHRSTDKVAQDTMAAITDAYSLNVLKSLLSSRYQVASTDKTNVCYSPVSLDDILKDIREQLVIAGVKMHFKVQDLRAMLQQYHPAMQEVRVRTRMPDGKQKNIRRWNMIIVGAAPTESKTNVCYSPVVLDHIPPTIIEDITEPHIIPDEPTLPNITTQELSPDELWRQEMQRKLTSTERHYTAPVEDANSSYDKVDNLQNYFDC